MNTEYNGACQGGQSSTPKLRTLWIRHWATHTGYGINYYDSLITNNVAETKVICRKKEWEKENISDEKNKTQIIVGIGTKRSLLKGYRFLPSDTPHRVSYLGHSLKISDYNISIY